MVNEPNESLGNLIPILRSNLNASEIVLARFSAAIRELVAQAATKTPTLDPKAIEMVITLSVAMQSDFTKFKASSDFILAYFENALK